MTSSQLHKFVLAEQENFTIKSSSLCSEEKVPSAEKLQWREVVQIEMRKGADGVVAGFLFNMNFREFYVNLFINIFS